MPTYSLPQVSVFQDFQIAPVSNANQLNAHISGGNASLVRYSNADEQADGFLGYYDNFVRTDHLWPNRPAGGIVDPGYTKVFIKDALLKYYSESAGTGYVALGQTNNRLFTPAGAFKSDANTSLGAGRLANLYSRDVAVGDLARVSFINGASELENVWTYVKAIEASSVDVSTVASDDVNNAAALGSSAVITKIGGPSNCMFMTVDLTDYHGEVSGFLSDTYTVTITQSSVGANLTTARMRIVSASGLDNVLTMIPGANTVFSVATPRGLKFKFTYTTGAPCIAAAAADGVPVDALVAGQVWSAAVRQAWSGNSVGVATGAATGIKATKFIAEVVRGGDASDADNPPLIRISTSNGAYPAYTVPYVEDALAATQYGPSFDFAETLLRKGDRYYLDVTLIDHDRAVLVLGHNVDSGFLVADDAVSLDLFIRRPLFELPRQRTESFEDYNWDQSETEISLIAGLQGYDASYTDGGELKAMDVLSEASKGYGKVYVEYRTWLSTLTGVVNQLNDVSEIDAIPGPLHPDNPLKWGVFKALSNSNGTAVGYTAVANPDVADDWVAVLDRLNGRNDTYGLVPMTNNRTVQDLFAAHVEAMSSPEEGLWRVAWFGLQGIPTIPIVHNGSTVSGHLESTSSDGEDVLATMLDDSLTSGSQYTILTVPASNGDFETNGVRAGDVVRTLFTNDDTGRVIYSEFVVDEVQSEDSLRLLTGPSAPQTVPIKIEIWRNLSATEEAAEIAQDAGSWGSRRIRAVWPDQAESAGTVQPGYFVAAALAGEASGILPHQGMTRLELSGFSDLPRTTRKFNRAQLNAMAVAGVWIVTQDINDGKIFTRHAVTTGSYEDLNEREEMVTRNIDAISYRIREHFEPFIGVTNVTPTLQILLRFEFDQIVRALQRERTTRQLGPQLISATLVELRPHTLLKDRYVLTFTGEIPYALNSFEGHIVI